METKEEALFEKPGVQAARRQRRDAEAAVLGAMLIDPEPVAPLVFEHLRAEDFSHADLRHLFEAALELYLLRRPIDPVTVNDRAGGVYVELLANIMLATPTAANVREYIEILQNQARLAQLQNLGWQLVTSHSMEESRGLLSDAYSMLLDQPRVQESTYLEMINEYLDRVTDGTEPNYLDWGIPKLSKLLHTVPGHFVILGADSSVGKTAFALQLAYNLGRSGKRVGFYSYETSRPEVIDRVLANSADVVLEHSKQKRLSRSELRAVTDEGARAEDIPLRVIESAGWAVDQIQLHMLSRRLEVIFLDYLQLIPAGFSGNPTQEVRQVSMSLHSMARRLGVTIVALSQVTLPEKPNNGKRRTITKNDLQWSSQLKNDADAIVLLDLVDPDDPSSHRVLKIDKNKDGKIGGFEMSFSPEHMRFAPLERDGEALPPMFTELEEDEDAPPANWRRQR